MTQNKNIANRYKRSQIESATPVQLVVMLYDAAIDSLKKALQIQEEDDSPDGIEKFHNQLIRCQNIITELTVSLDMDRGEEIAKNLFRLYEYMNHRLIDANIKKDEEPVKEVIKLLEILREGWVSIQDKDEAQVQPKNQGPTGLNLQG